MPSTKFYVLTGARDEIVTTLFPTLTAIFLRDAGIPVTFYSQSDGTHLLYSLRSILSQAWKDMESGVVRVARRARCRRTGSTRSHAMIPGVILSLL